jgi:L-amino acid N-acyltransferase YncA
MVDPTGAPDPNELQVRDADPGRDAAACAAIYAPSVEGSIVSFEVSAPDAGEMEDRMRTYQETHPWLIAERGGEVVGYAYAAVFNPRPSYRWTSWVSVYVAAAEHGRGHGRALYEALFERMRAQGLRTAMAGITLPNPASVALHESLGFEQVGLLREIGWKEGQWLDVGWWQRAVIPPSEEQPPEPGAPG